MSAHDRATADAGSVQGAVADVRSRLIDRWFPCSSVDNAVGTPAGSGRSEKALFTWFASRPIAQARAAVLSTLLPDNVALQADVAAAIERGD
jgi:putative DNA methylase